MPNSTLQINLANNYIKEIQENDLSNLTVARTIILKNNAIGSVNQSVRLRMFFESTSASKLHSLTVDVPVAASTGRSGFIIK